MDTFICVRYSNKGNTCRTAPVYQYDKGIQLHVLNLNESHVVQIHYSISGMYQALTRTPTYEVDKWISNIPNVLLAQQEEIQAYIYVSDGEDSSQTVMHISIPVTPRPKPDGYEYTEAELKGLDYVLSQVSEAVAGVDDAVAKAYAAYEHIPYIDAETNHWMQWDVLTEQFVDTGIVAIGQPGKDGSDGKDGLDGKDGKDFVILGVAATADELATKAPNPEQGDHYNVGPDDRGMYLLYMYDTELGWVDKGVANGGGSGNIIMDFDDNIPRPLGEGSPGTSESPSRSDHEHPMPTAKDIGALYIDPEGSEAGPPALINADTLGGIPAADFVQVKNIASAEESLLISKTIQELGDEKVAEINETGDTKIDAIESAGQKELTAIKAVGADQLIANLNAAGNAQQSAIENKGANTLASIPDDYTTIYNDVSSLKDHKADAIVCEASGSVITLDDASDAHLHGLRIFGKTTQDGTPTPDAPVPLVSVGGGGSIKVVACGKNLIPFDLFTGLNSTKFTSNMIDGQSVITIDVSTSTFARANVGHIWSEVPKTSLYTFSAYVYAPSPTNCRLSILNLSGYSTVAKSEALLSAGWTRLFVSAELTIGSGYAFVVGGTRDEDVDISVNRWMVEYGSITTAYEPYKDGGSVTLSTPNGLPGIPVTAGGNYTDENGQQCFCDEIDLERGVRINRLTLINPKKVIGGYVGPSKEFLGILVDGETPNITDQEVGAVLCTHVPVVKARDQYFDGGSVISSAGGTVYISIDGIGTATQLNTFLSENDVWVLYPNLTPVEIPLSDAEIAAYKLLHTNKPNTTIYNDAGAWQTVEYAADTKRYIDKKFDALAAALLS